MFAYEKAVLKTYRQTSANIKNLSSAIIKGAQGSFHSKKSAKDLAEKLLQLVNDKNELEGLKLAVQKTLSEMKPCHAYLLCVKYGVGKYAKEKPFDKTNGYYRKAAYALGKFAQGMKSLGYTPEVYQNVCARFEYIGQSYERFKKFEEKVYNCGNLKVNGKSLIPKK